MTPHPVTELLPSHIVLYRLICMSAQCGVEYGFNPVVRTYETEAEVISHGLCRECVKHYEENHP